MGAEESDRYNPEVASAETHFLDENVHRVRSLCDTHGVPFSERKSTKCGKPCEIILSKQEYTKVRFRDESEFWFPSQTIKLKRSKPHRRSYSTSAVINGQKSSAYHLKSARRTSQERALNKNYPAQQHQQQEPDISRNNYDRKSKNTYTERTVHEGANFSKSVENKYPHLNRRDKYLWSERGSVGRKSMSSVSSSLWLPSSTIEQYGCPDTKSELDRTDHSAIDSVQLDSEPTGIPSPVVSSARSRTTGYKLPVEYTEENPTYRNNDDRRLYRESRKDRPEPFIDIGPLLLRDASGRDKFKYPVGFDNLGNTCYINAALQCLLNNRMIMGAVELFYKSRQRPRLDSLPREFLALVKRYALLGERPGRAVSPEGIRDAFVDLYPEFEGYCEHDASEFLSYLLGEIGETPTDDKKYTTIDSLFRLFCNIERRHNKRSPVISSKDSQLLLSLPVEIKHKKGRRKVTMDLPDLESAIAYETNFTRQHCEITIEGQRYSSFEQRSTIIASSTPPFLIVHLKRFGVFRGFQNSMNVEKMNVNIKVPLRLDISKFTDDPNVENKYVLVGAICHYGRQSSSGHFYSIIKPYEENYWFIADDVHVKEAKSIRPEIKHIYVCFYRKVSS